MYYIEYVDIYINIYYLYTLTYVTVSGQEMNRPNTCIKHVLICILYYILSMVVDIYGSVWTKAALSSHSNTHIACINIYALTYILNVVYRYLY